MIAFNAVPAPADDDNPQTADTTPIATSFARSVRISKPLIADTSSLHIEFEPHIGGAGAAVDFPADHDIGTGNPANRNKASIQYRAARQFPDHKILDSHGRLESGRCISASDLNLRGEMGRVVGHDSIGAGQYIVLPRVHQIERDEEVFRG